MKLDISIELGWIDEDNNIDDFVQKKIVDAVTNSLKKEVVETIQSESASRISQQVDSFLTKTLDGFMNREIIITDKWGDVKERHENVNEMLKTKFGNFLDEKVDSNGKRVTGCSYGKTITRIEYLLDKRIDNQVNVITKEIAMQVDSKLEKSLQQALKDKVSETLLKKIDMESFLKDTVK